MTQTQEERDAKARNRMKSKYDNDPAYREERIAKAKIRWQQRYKNDREFRDRCNANSVKRIRNKRNSDSIFRQKYSAAGRRRYLLRKYDLTVDQYDIMLEQQGGVCGICGERPGNKTLAVDHCHDTGVVRGLLCWNCNRALGLIGDENMQKAAEWTQRKGK